MLRTQRNEGVSNGLYPSECPFWIRIVLVYEMALKRTGRELLRDERFNGRQTRRSPLSLLTRRAFCLLANHLVVVKLIRVTRPKCLCQRRLRATVVGLGAMAKFIHARVLCNKSDWASSVNVAFHHINVEFKVVRRRDPVGGVNVSWTKALASIWCACCSMQS